jgi:endonuclease/exonuclease/phosphatase family metal-dependent hydrolase
VTLQEASLSRRHGNVPEHIAKALGFHLVFAPATDRIFHLRPLDALIVGIMGFMEGEAILSRFPIVASEIYDLPRCRSKVEPRILLRADLDMPGGLLHVFTTHTAREDECQMERVGEIVREQRDDRPSILTGDFNTLETSKVLTLLRDEAGFIDAFRSANPTTSGVTVWQRILATQSTASRRVDFIFLLGGHASPMTVISSNVVLDRPGRLSDGAALWPSDHYGVSADLEILPINPRYNIAQ